jgi:aldose sugar dehydrogenase
MEPARYSVYRAAGILAAIILLVGSWFILFQNNPLGAPQTDSDEDNQSTSPPPAPGNPNATPTIETQTIMENLDHVWEIAFLPSGEMLFTERNGAIKFYRGGDARQLIRVDDVFTRGEGGLMGLAVDPEFNKNGYVYACFNSVLPGAPDVRVARWHLKSDFSALEARKDILTGMPSNATGRHSGCRIAWGPDHFLWVGTGDSAQGFTPQSQKSLGGKILRIDRDGNPAQGNIGGAYDPRIFSYGHRNTQGLAFFSTKKNDSLGVSVEHGSSVDDEVNLLKKGNFGWGPKPEGYVEKDVPMTDKAKFPDAHEAVWKSGSPAQAPSGATIIKSEDWLGWKDALAVGMLKSQHLKILKLNGDGVVVKEERALESSIGRIRTVVNGPDGNLYIGTDNGSGSDRIIRLIPHVPEEN